MRRVLAAVEWAVVVDDVANAADARACRTERVELLSRIGVGKVASGHNGAHLTLAGGHERLHGGS